MGYHKHPQAQVEKRPTPSLPDHQTVDSSDMANIMNTIAVALALFVAVNQGMLGHLRKTNSFWIARIRQVLADFSRHPASSEHHTSRQTEAISFNCEGLFVTRSLVSSCRCCTSLSLMCVCARTTNDLLSCTVCVAVQSKALWWALHAAVWAPSTSRTASTAGSSSSRQQLPQMVALVQPA